MTIRYMGTKRHMVDGVRDHILALSPDGRVVDLFSGMGSVVESMSSSKTPVVTNDALEFTACFSRARFTGRRRSDTPEAVAARLRARFYAARASISRDFTESLQAERDALGGTREDLVNYFRQAAHVANSAVSRRRACHAHEASGVAHYYLAALYFSAGYLSLQQAIEVDALRYAIDQDDVSESRDWLISGWIAAIAAVLNAPGHTAQYLRPNNDAAHARLIRTWQRSIWYEFKEALERTQQVGTASWRSSNEVVVSDALDLVQGGRLANVGVVYADPPYTKDQYSRFYHVYETLYRYDYPDASGAGRARSDRFSTGFSLKSSVRASFHDLCRHVARMKVPLVVTTYGYDDNTGLPTTTTSGGKTITTGYDAWGRGTSYLDALGTSSSTTYDAAGNVATFNDGTATYTYTYDSHNILTGVDPGASTGAFTFAYATNGDLSTVTYPNGVVAKGAHDQIGEQTGLTYSQGSTELLGFSAALDVAGRTWGQASVASTQQFGYDDLGRLTTTQDVRANGCTTRSYGFDASSNRNSFASYNPGASGACQTTTATVNKTNSYDSAGRITNSGYTYDTLGRTLTTPQADAGPNAAGPLSATYHADDMVASLSQSVKSASGSTEADVMTYALEPTGRVGTITTTTSGVESLRLRYRYANGSDSPVDVDTSVDGGTTWTATRYIAVPGLGTVASTSGTGTTTIDLSNPHGDIVATMADTPGASTVASYAETDEFGNAFPGAVSSARFQWLGSQSRSSDALAGLLLMGARMYNPVTGMFTSADPVIGGNVTAYTYPQDPLDQFDLSGRLLPDPDSSEPCKCNSTNQFWTVTSSWYVKGPWKRPPEWLARSWEAIMSAPGFGVVTITDLRMQFRFKVESMRRCVPNRKGSTSGHWEYKTVEYGIFNSGDKVQYRMRFWIRTVVGWDHRHTTRWMDWIG